MKKCKGTAKPDAADVEAAAKVIAASLGRAENLLKNGYVPAPAIGASSGIFHYDGLETPANHYEDLEVPTTASVGVITKGGLSDQPTLSPLHVFNFQQ